MHTSLVQLQVCKEQIILVWKLSEKDESFTKKPRQQGNQEPHTHTFARTKTRTSKKKEKRKDERNKTPDERDTLLKTASKGYQLNTFSFVFF